MTNGTAGISKKFRLRWHSPGKSSIVIYDRAGEGVLRRLLSPDIDVLVLDTRDTLYLTPIIVVHAVALFLTRSWRGSVVWRKASIRVCYEYALIASIKPLVVINHSEANLRFGLLSCLYPLAEFLGIQNGYRQSEIESIAHLNHLTNAFCFGQEVVDKYRKAGAQIRNYYVIGSLTNGLYQEFSASVAHYARTDICLISQYRSNRFDRETTELATITTILMDLIAKYCKDKKKSCLIAGNAKPGIEANREIQFFERWVNSDHIHFLPNDRSSFSTHSSVDASEVAICVNSTAGIEALGRGAKILFCNFSENSFFDLYGEFKHGIWSMSDKGVTYEKFDRQLTKLFCLSTEDWIKESAVFREHFIGSAYGGLPQEVLRERISRMISKPAPSEILDLKQGGVENRY